MSRKSTSKNKLVDEKKIEKLVELMKKHKLDIIQAETEAEKICLARNVASLGFIQQKNINQSQNGYATSATYEQTVNKPENHENLAESNKTLNMPDGHRVKCPFVGTFYRSPSPDSPAFVEIGSQVKKGQTLCIIEAMKLMNEIESEMDGKIIAILKENGDPVEFGSELFIISPN